MFHVGSLKTLPCSRYISQEFRTLNGVSSILQGFTSKVHKDIVNNIACHEAKIYSAGYLLYDF